MSPRTIASLAGLALGLLADPVFAEESHTVEPDAISVTSDYESPTGPVKGYRAPHSSSATKTDTAIRDIPQSISVIPVSVLKDLVSTSVERTGFWTRNTSSALPAITGSIPVSRAISLSA
jgi:iron complex outermembrane receptor protein